MLFLIAYDVNTMTFQGKKRLHLIAKECCNYGQRVQNSVFECLVDTANLELLKEKLLDQIDETKDSLYFFNIGKKYHHKIEKFGSKDVIDLDGPIIF